MMITPVIYAASYSTKIKILDASEEIKFLSQSIAKDYIYMYSLKQTKPINNDIQNKLNTLDADIRTISASSNDEKVKRILTLFDYEREVFSSQVAHKITAQNASQALEFSSALLEGAEYLSNYAHYTYTKEEQMLILSKKVAYTSEMFFKYYMVLASNMDTLDIDNKIQKTIITLEKLIIEIQKYNYPKELLAFSKDLNLYLDIYKKLYESISSAKLPTIAITVSNGFRNSLEKLSQYHRKN